jgi:hypothetical protein
MIRSAFLFLLVTAFLCLLFVASVARAGGHCYTSSAYSSRSYASYAPSYSYGHSYSYAPSYAYAYKQEVLVPYAVKAVISPDYYFSTQDHYREQTLADAIAYRVLTMQQKGLMPGQQTPITQPQPQQQQHYQPNQQSQPQGPAHMPHAAPNTVPGNAPAGTGLGAAPAGLDKIIADKCVRCHNGSQTGRVNLSDLSNVSLATRWECFGRVIAGDMPRGSKRCEDEEIKLFGQWTERQPR